MTDRGAARSRHSAPARAAAAVAVILALTGACSSRDVDAAAPPSPSATAPNAAPNAAPTSTTAPTGSPPATGKPSQLTMTSTQARADTGALLDSDCFARHVQTLAPDPEDCSFGFFDGDTVVLYGDSHAAQWFGTAVEVAVRHDWRLLPVAKVDCPPGEERVLDPDLSGEYTQCAAWHTAAMDLIESQEPILVVVAAQSDQYRILGDDGEPLSSPESAERLAQALAEDLQAFAAMGARTVLIRDTQVPGFDVPDCLAAHGPDACSYGLAETSPEDSAQRAAAKASGTAIVDLREEVCGDRVECVSVIDGLITFRDAEHVTNTFGTSLADELEAGIQAVPA